MKTLVLLAPLLLAGICAFPAGAAESDYFAQSPVSLGLTLSQAVPGLQPRDAAGKVITGAKVFSNSYTDSRGNRIAEIGSTALRTRYSNREFLNDLKNRGVISTISGYTIVRMHHADDSGTYFLQRKLAGNQLERIDISAYLRDSLPSMALPVSQKTGRTTQNAAGAEVSYSYSNTAFGGFTVEIAGLFPVPSSESNTGTLTLGGSGSFTQRYVQGKGHSLSAVVNSLSGGYSRVVRAQGEAAGPNDYVLAEGSFTIAPATFVLNSAPANQPSSGTITSGGIIRSGGATLSSNLTLSAGDTWSGSLILLGGGTLSGGTISPGSSPGTLSTGGLTIGESGNALNTNGTLLLIPPPPTITVNSGVTLQFAPEVNGEFTLIEGNNPASLVTVINGTIVPATNP